MGVIYIITNRINGRQYVGQTKHDDVTIRWNQHKQCAKRLKRFKAGEVDTCDNQSTYLYNSMVEHGIDNFEFAVVDGNVATCDLNLYEVEFIKSLNTLRPNGYNSTTGGSRDCEVSEETRKLASASIRAAVCRIRGLDSEDTIDLPMHIVRHNKGDARGYAICRHPLCDFRSFTLSDYESLPACKAAAIAFIVELERDGIVRKFTKKNLDLPTGITPFRNGYAAKRKVNGVLYKKAFCRAEWSLETKLQMAIDFLESVPK